MLTFAFECIAACPILLLVLFKCCFKSTDDLFMLAFLVIHISDLPSIKLQKRVDTSFHPSRKKIPLSKTVINNKYHTELKVL